MADVKQKSSGGLQQKDADLLARLFNVTFNNVTVYGSDHPSYENTIGKFCTAIIQKLDMMPLITLMLERDSIFIEQWCVDNRVSRKKIAIYFKKVNIESISFKKGVTEKDIRSFLEIIVDTKQYPEVEAMKAALKAEKIFTVLINYAAYQKVTLDETIISKDQELTHGKIGLESSLIDLLVGEERDHSFSVMKQGLENSDGNIVAEQIVAIRKDLDEKELNTTASSDEVVAAVVKLKDDLAENMEVQKELGKVLEHEDELISELDRLSLQVIVKLVKEEYKKENISIKRLAQIIRRILPKAEEIKRIFPRLKTALIEAGMPLVDFLELARELNTELQEQELVQALGKGADKWGLTADDIVKEIKDDPEEAAKLIILASEIKHGVQNDQEQLSHFLTDYIEKVSTQMALTASARQEQQDHQTLKALLSSLETRLLQEAGKQGLSKDVLKDVKMRLSKGFEKNLKNLQSQWVVSDVDDPEKEISPLHLFNKLGKVLSKGQDLAGLEDPLKNALAEKGLAPEQIQQFYDKFATKLTQKAQLGKSAERILSAGNLKMFLHHEILRSLRYHDPFSCLAISVQAINDLSPDGDEIAQDIEQIIPQIFSILLKNIRATDIIGYLRDNMPLIILTKNQREDIHVSKDRISKALSHGPFYLNDREVCIDFVISDTYFDKSITQDLESYIKFVERQHQLQVEKAKKNTAMRQKSAKA